MKCRPGDAVPAPEPAEGCEPSQRAAAVGNWWAERLQSRHMCSCCCALQCMALAKLAHQAASRRPRPVNWARERLPVCANVLSQHLLHLIQRHAPHPPSGTRQPALPCRPTGAHFARQPDTAGGLCCRPPHLARLKLTCMDPVDHATQWLRRHSATNAQCCPAHALHSDATAWCPAVVRPVVSWACNAVLCLSVTEGSALQLPSLAAFSALQRLDVSFNQFRSLQPCTSLPGGALTELYAASNKISRIEVRPPWLQAGAVHDSANGTWWRPSRGFTLLQGPSGANSSKSAEQAFVWHCWGWTTSISCRSWSC